MTQRARVRLIHWHAGEAAERAARLRGAGYEADAVALTRPETRKALRADPPAAFVIDLSRLPMQGRDLALALREWRSTRRVPLVFVGGAPEKVEKVRASLPDAAFTEWSRIARDLATAIARPPADPVVPSSRLAGYSGTPLPKKLGIKPGSRVVLAGAPEGFEAMLGVLPDGASLARDGRAARDLTLWFVRSRRELERGIARMAKLCGPGHLWIVWPKKTSALAGDVGEPQVRAAGLAAGIVDFKVCAVDETWSGLAFARRRADVGAAPKAAMRRRPLSGARGSRARIRRGPPQ